MVTLPLLLAAVGLPVAVLSQSLTFNSPPSTVCGLANFTWTYEGITGDQALNMSLALAFQPVASQGATVASPFPTTAPASGSSSSTGTTKSAPVVSTINPDTSATSTTSSTTPTSTTPTIANGWANLGCAVDTSSRALTGTMYQLNNNTIEYCQSYCSTYVYAAVEDGNQCFCGNVLVNTAAGAAAPAPSASCNIACAGDPTEMCGAAFYMNLYSRVGATPSATPAATSTSTSTSSSSTSSSVTLTSAAGLNPSRGPGGAGSTPSVAGAELVMRNTFHRRQSAQSPSADADTVIVPLTKTSVEVDPLGMNNITQGWYVLTALSNSSDPSSPALWAETPAFYVTPTCPTSSSTSSGMSTGAKIGIAVGIAGAAIVLLLIVLALRRRRKTHRSAPSAQWQDEPRDGGLVDFPARPRPSWRRSYSNDEKDGADVPMSPLGGTPVMRNTAYPPSSAAAAAAVAAAAAQDPFAEHEEPDFGNTTQVSQSSSASSAGDYLQPVQHAPMPQALPPPIMHPYNPYPSSSADQYATPSGQARTQSPPPNLRVASPPGGASFIPSFEESPTSALPYLRRGSDQSTTGSFASAAAGPYSRGTSRRGSTQGSQSAAAAAAARRPPAPTVFPRPMSDTEATQSSTNLALVASSGSTSTLATTGTGAPGASLQKSHSLQQRPARKPVPAYRVESFQITPPLASLPVPPSPGLHMGDSDQSLPLPSADARAAFYTDPARNSSGLDPGLAGRQGGWGGDMPHFAGQKAGMHMLVPDMPSEQEQQGRR